MAQQNPDAIALLMEDHRMVEQMFEEYEGLGERAVVSKKRLAEKICTALAVHAQLEEELFYPAVHEASKELEDLVDEAVVEHASAKDLIGQIMAMEADDELFDAKVKVLSEQIQHHVKEEEGEMFPKVRKGGLFLDKLAESMRERKEELESGEVTMPLPDSVNIAQSPEARR